MFLLMYILLIGSEVLAYNYKIIHVYVPQHLVNDAFRALENIPGVEFKLLHSNIRKQKQQIYHYDIGMDYYDDNDNYYNDKKKTVSKRLSRSASHGGYTSDQDTCQMYNHNLIKVWSKFSKYVIPGNHEVPSKMALHNIAQIVEAYLGHQDSYNSENDKDTGSDTNSRISDSEPDVDISEIVKKVKKIVIDTIDEETTGKIIDLIVNSVSSAVQDKWDETCIKRAKDRLRTYVSGTFEKYLENATCRRNANSEEILNNKNKMRHAIEVSENSELNFKDAKKILRQWQNDYENCEKNAQDKFLHIIRLIIQNYMNDLRC